MVVLRKQTPLLKDYLINLHICINLHPFLLFSLFIQDVPHVRQFLVCNSAGNKFLSYFVFCLSISFWSLYFHCLCLYFWKAFHGHRLLSWWHFSFNAPLKKSHSSYSNVCFHVYYCPSEVNCPNSQQNLIFLFFWWTEVFQLHYSYVFIIIFKSCMDLLHIFNLWTVVSYQIWKILN